MRWSPRAADGEPAGDSATDDAFGALVVAALDALPDVFRDRLGSVAIVVEDEPTGDQLRSVGAHALFGLYQGVPRTSWAADRAVYASPATIVRGPLPRVTASEDARPLRAAHD